MPPLFLTIIRYLMMIICGVLVTRGVITAEYSEAVIGLGSATAALIWYLFSKYFPERAKSLSDDLSDEAGA